MHHTMKRSPALLLAASFTAAQIPCGGMAKAKPKLSTKRLSIVTGKSALLKAKNVKITKWSVNKSSVVKLQRLKNL